MKNEYNQKKINLSSGLEEVKLLRQKYNEYILSLSDNSPTFNLSLLYPKTDDIEELKEQVDDLKKCIESFRPLNSVQAQNLEEVFDIEYTYDSNRIEGNTMTLSETALVLQKGITVDGRSLREHLETINHKDALDYIKELVKGNIEFTEQVLLRIHMYILQGINRIEAGFYRRAQVFITGSRHVPPNYMKISAKMEEYFQFYQENKDKLHSVILSSEMHERLVDIHPFIDGNGRTARLIMNFLLMKHGYPIAIISGDRKMRLQYYETLEKAHIEKKSEDFYRLILKEVKKTSFRYLEVLPLNGYQEEQKKGEYFFKKIQPFLDKT